MVDSAAHPSLHTPPRPGLLATVRCEAELRAVLEARCNVSVLDIKEPLQGPLGRPDLDELDRIVETSGKLGRRTTDVQCQQPLSFQGDSPAAFAPSCGKLGRTDDDTNTDPLIAPALSLAAGELFELEQITGNELDRLRKCLHHFEFIKVGLAGVAEQPTGRRDWPQRLERCRRRLGIRNLIVAAYADFEVAAAPDVAIVVESAAQLNCAGVLIDTNAKQPGTNLFSHLTIDCLNQFSRRLRSQNRLFAIAGSLTERELAAAVSCGPDLIGMRGGLCHGGDRNRQIDIRKIQSVVTALNQHRNSGPYQTGGNTSLR